jgi:hypothetical protein
LLAQDANRAEHAQLHRADRCPQRFGNFVVGLFFYQREHRCYLQLGWQTAKCLLDLLPRLLLEKVIGRKRSIRLCEQTPFGALASEMVDRQVGGDPSRPGGEVTVRPEPVARLVDAPESLHSQILRDSGVAHYAHNPGVDIALALTDQCLESIDLAMRKSPEQIHELVYCLLRGQNEWVTSFFRRSPERGRETTKSHVGCPDGKGAYPRDVAPSLQRWEPRR